MNKYVVFCRGTYDESDYYIGIEASSKEEVVGLMNKRLNLVLEENKKHEEYADNFSRTPYSLDMNEDEYANYRKYMDANPYKYTPINDLPFTIDQVYSFPDEFWNIVHDNGIVI